ncbi:MAG: calcium/sodium antiporter [Rhodovibrionaceae bacterium]|nr:calcium/sodium antiporter [Rhodovibrionaceae bacterium]
MSYLFATAGLIFLFVGGESLVRGAVITADRLGVSPILIAFVVVGFGTSAPELVVCLEAAFRDQPDIALGNVVGSNIANILLILGIAAIVRPLVLRNGFMRRDNAAMVIATLVLVALGLYGRILAWQGLLMIAALGGYLVFSLWCDRREAGQQSFVEHEMEEMRSLSLGPKLALLALFGGLGLLILGSHLLVGGAIEIAVSFGIPQAVIGLSLVAIGTSLPELATAVIASYRGHPDVALGNVLGSNVFNILGMLGVTALVTQVPIGATMLRVDFMVMLAAALLLALLLVSKRTMRAPLGAAMVAAYGAYIYFIFTGYSAL